MNRVPDEIDKYGNKYWYDDNYEYHNNGYPAVIYKSGYKAWFKHGKNHNDNGPAVIWSSGTKLWFIDGKELSEQKFLQYKIKNFINE